MRVAPARSHHPASSKESPLSPRNPRPLAGRNHPESPSEPHYFSQSAALWVFIAYLVTGRHDKSTARAFAVAAVLVTAAVLGLYAL